MAQTKVKLISDGVIDVNHLASGHSITTDNIGEGSNLYYTDARVSTYLSTNSYATEGYVTTAVANLVDSAPTTLDTLNELAAALGDDPNFATTVTNSIATKLPLAGGNITGTLGIGVSIPSNTLHIYKNATIGPITTTNTANAVLRIQDGSTSMYFDGNSIILDNTGYLTTAGAYDFVIGTNNTARMHIDSGGNIGVGTNFPDDKFQIDAPNSQLRLRDTDDTTYTQFSSSGNLLAIRQNSTTASHFWMNSDGDVGLGTNTPDQKLEVVGNAHINYSLLGRGIRSANRGELFLNATGAGDVSEIFFGYGDGYTENNIRWGISDRGTASGILSFYVGPAVSPGGGFSTAMALDANGYLGLGTTSPANKLNVNGDIGFTGYLGQGNIYGNTGNASYARVQLYDPSTGYTTFNNISYGYYFQTNSGTKLTILNDGKVGIGNTSPQAPLHAFSAGTNNVQEIVAVLGSTSNRPVLQFSESIQGTITSGMSLEYNGNGSGDSNYMVINSVANVPRFAVMSGGNVGIGTTSPNAKLDVAGNAKFAGDGTYTLLLNRQTGVPTIKGAATTAAHLIIDSASGSDAVFLQNYNSGNVYMVTGGGSVGVGTTSPSAKLHVEGSVDGEIAARIHNASAASGATAALTIDATGNNFAIRHYPDADTANANKTKFVTTAGGGHFTFEAGGAEQLRINSTGVGVGITSPSAGVHIVNDTALKINTSTNGAGAKINFSDHQSGGYTQNGTIEYVHSDVASFGSGNAFKFYGTESSMSFHVAGKGLFTSTVTENYSDIRLKTKIGDIKNALDKIQSLSGFYYEPNETAQSYGYEVKKEIGLSAQEVQQVIPEVVTEAAIGDGYLTIHYQKIVPVLVEAIKELKAEVEALKQQLNG